ncbi:MAG TPA: GNAT family N-acetyltransferase, partial [Actinomycetota bacterium]|nr:GNAT family N-acetyltransferase [Actinomycetota bacterium]
LRTAALLVQRGARLVATNADATYPAPDGLWPGAGSILAAVVTATGANPIVVGKPARPMFETAAERIGSFTPLVVGDRLDTDIAGAAALGWDSLLVTTGAHGYADLIGTPAVPTYVGDGLAALGGPATRVGFRAATSADVDAIDALLRAGGLAAEGVEERIAHTVVGEDDDGRPVATAVAEPLERDVLVRSVAVSEDLRGRGVGALAVATAMSAAPHASSEQRIWAFTETAAAFFARLGFEPVDRDALPPPVADSRQLQQECAVTATVMVRVR